MSYVFVGYDDYSVLQLCVDGTGEAGLVQMGESFDAGIAFPLVAGVLYFTHNIIWFYVLSAWGAIYGCSTFILLIFMIRRYHRQLKERFSYQENINLNWLLAILNTFFLILFLWTLSCFVINVDYDNIYMVSSLILWMLIDYLFIGMNR